MSSDPHNTADWDRMQDLFREARSLPPDERTRFLAEQCADDPGALKRLREMFAAHDEETWDLKRTEMLSAPVVEAEPAHIGDTIGPYEVRSVLGRGGFAVVYLADQTRPIRRQVALKIIKVGMDTREVLARFEAERQTLALMSHPNVATVYDAGVMESGRPYFAMEYVDGLPITKRSQLDGLDLTRRLQLFTQVCAAVQHAHQKGVIHRDLKPSNILVADKDGRHLVKVIDFGIAKALGESQGDVTAQTQQGQIIGTLRYMSPEQIEGRAGDVDTRTDVYSLGVVLYEIVTHELPFGERGTAGTWADIRDAMSGEPVRPSDRLSRAHRAADLNGGPASTISAREVRRELDWIILRAIDRDRDRRYQSASELALDIERYLNDQPVLARPASVAYRFGKFAKRHRAFVIGAALLFLAMIAGTVTTAIQARRADTAQRRALREASVAGAVTVFLQETFTAGETDVRSALDAARPRIDEIGDIEVKTLVQAIVGRIYMNAGAHDDAVSQLSAAFRAARALYGQNDLRSLSIQYDLARTHLESGEDALAEPLLLHLTSGDAAGSLSADQVAGACAGLVRALTNLRRFDEAREALRAAKANPAFAACSEAARASIRDAEMRLLRETADDDSSR